jgi:hypothetical protein
MSARASFPLWIVMLCIAGLLCVQMSGLHQHRHVALDGSSDRHDFELHFEDVGWHGDRAAEHHHEAAIDTVHPHLDIETKVLDDGVAKLLLVIVLGVLAGWHLQRQPHRRLGRLPRTAAVAPRKRSCFDGPPPSQAPPVFL